MTLLLNFDILSVAIENGLTSNKHGPWRDKDEFERHFSCVILFSRRRLKSTDAGIRLRREVVRLQVYVVAHLDINQREAVGVGEC
jgi:hypothetical protein